MLEDKNTLTESGIHLKMLQIIFLTIRSPGTADIQTQG
jgi:hypothetical protein